MCNWFLSARIVVSHCLLHGGNFENGKMSLRTYLTISLSIVLAQKCFLQRNAASLSSTNLRRLTLLSSDSLSLLSLILFWRNLKIYPRERYDIENPVFLFCDREWPWRQAGLERYWVPLRWTEQNRKYIHSSTTTSAITWHPRARTDSRLVGSKILARTGNNPGAMQATILCIHMPRSVFWCVEDIFSTTQPLESVTGSKSNQSRTRLKTKQRLEAVACTIQLLLAMTRPNLALFQTKLKIKVGLHIDFFFPKHLRTNMSKLKWFLFSATPLPLMWSSSFLNYILLYSTRMPTFCPFLLFSDS